MRKLYLQRFEFELFYRQACYALDEDPPSIILPSVFMYRWGFISSILSIKRFPRGIIYLPLPLHQLYEIERRLWWKQIEKDVKTSQDSSIIYVSDVTLFINIWSMELAIYKIFSWRFSLSLNRLWVEKIGCQWQVKNLKYNFFLHAFRFILYFLPFSFTLHWVVEGKSILPVVFLYKLQNQTSLSICQLQNHFRIESH